MSPESFATRWVNGNIASSLFVTYHYHESVIEFLNTFDGPDILFAF